MGRPDHARQRAAPHRERQQPEAGGRIAPPHPHSHQRRHRLPCGQVFSDEFYPSSYTKLPFYYSNNTQEARQNGACAGNGQCPWTATYQLNSDTNGETFMHPEMVKVTADGAGCESGCLNISAEHAGFGGAGYLGGQLSSWNLLCYQGGYLEVRFQLPGQPREAASVGEAAPGAAALGSSP